MRGTGNIERLDDELASLAREEAALRLRLGQLLEVMSRGAVFDLGFSSLGAYAVERCERSVRWVEGARCVARRLEALPGLRRAMATGKVSWSMGELLARVATLRDEARWLELAESRTVRQVRVLVAEATAAARQAATSGTDARAARVDQHVAIAGAGHTAEAEDGLSNLTSGPDEICMLTCTVDREDAWLFEATRQLLEQLGVRGAVAQGEALLAEALGTLLDLVPQGVIDVDGLQRCDVAQRRWVEQLHRWRGEAEVLCEKNILGKRAPRAAMDLGVTEQAAMGRTAMDPTASVGLLALAASLGMAHLDHASSGMLDQQVRAVADVLARHELELSKLVLRFHRADGWRRLGYATEAQYARERLGLSCSSLVVRRALALRLERLPGVAAALGSAHIGVEAALQLVRIATPKTEAAWIERARRRTIKHLREEVAAALTAVRLADERDCLPPEDADMATFHALEQAVVSGRFGQASSADGGHGAAASLLPGGQRLLAEPGSEPRRAWYVMLGSLTAWLHAGLQMSAAAPCAVASRACSSAGRVTLRLRMSRESCTWWHALEAQARRWLPPGMSWLRFLCLSVWQGWHHLLGTSVAYGHIYVRDRFRCASPVCNRRDVTPHHLVFRSAGGSDHPRNVVSLCTWCHLLGVHGGRIRALGTADHIHWELGPMSSPSLVVHGRERMVA